MTNQIRTAALVILSLLTVSGGLAAWSIHSQLDAATDARNGFHVTAEEWKRMQSETDANDTALRELQIQVGKIEKAFEMQSRSFEKWEETQKQQWKRVETTLNSRNP